MLIWFYTDLKEWIKSGCDIEIALKVVKLDISRNNIKVLDPEIGLLINLKYLCFSDNKIIYFPPEIGNLINLQYLICSNNQLIEFIPEIGNLINLQYFYCNNNKIIEFIPEVCSLIKLKDFNCKNNQIKKFIPEIGNLINLIYFNCHNNQITYFIQEIGYLINLQYFNCSQNNLTKIIPDIGKLINLQYFYCNQNQITEIVGDIGNLINLIFFDCNDNKITELIPEICSLIYLIQFNYSNNPIEYINPQILRFINRHKIIQKIYSDTESVHNHQIQEGISNSIKYIMSIKPTIIIDELTILILHNKILTQKTKNILFEYADNIDVHSLLNITFKELLLNIYSLIIKNENSDEIFQIMNIEMNDSLCKCFTGRISRLVNCLNGFDENININISDNEQIGNIIILIKNKLIIENNYDLESHKKLVKTSLLERGYELNVIEEWLEYCE